MNTEPKLNAYALSLFYPSTPNHKNEHTAQSLEQHAVSCWLAIEKHVDGSPRCGCYQHSITRHIVILKSCDVGESLAEEYLIASRRVREIQAEQSTLEQGDFDPDVPFPCSCGPVCACGARV